MAGHGLRQGIFCQEHLSVAAFLHQPLGLVLIVAAHHNVHTRVQSLRGLDHLAHLQCVGGGHHQHRGPRDVRLDQDCGLHCVAKHGGHAIGPQGLYQLPVLLGHHKRDIVSRQRRRHAPPHPAVTNQHHLPREIARIGGRG